MWGCASNEVAGLLGITPWQVQRCNVVFDDCMYSVSLGRVYELMGRNRHVAQQYSRVLEVLWHIRDNISTKELHHGNAL